MTTLVSGNLLDPSGNVISNAEIVLTAISTSFAVLGGASVRQTADDSGAYSFSLEPGNYSIYVAYNGKNFYFGAITITSTTAPATLNQLLNDSLMTAEMSPDYLTYFQEQTGIILTNFDTLDASVTTAVNAAGTATTQAGIASGAATTAKASSDAAIGLSKSYATMALAQAAITAGTIPNFGLFSTVSTYPSQTWLMWQNVNSTPTAVIDPSTGAQKTYPSGAAVEAVSSIVKTSSSDLPFSITDDIGNIHSKIDAAGHLTTPSIETTDSSLSVGDITIKLIDKDALIQTDQNGFILFDSSNISSGGGDEPIDVTVNLPPQSAAYTLLSKMRAGLEDVCVICNSDSTGITSGTDGTTPYNKWIYKLASYLATSYPGYTVLYYDWNLSSNSYNAAVTLQTGTLGKTLYFYNAAAAGTQPFLLMGNYFETAYAPRTADMIIINHGHNNDANAAAGTHAGMILGVAYTMLNRHPAAGVMMVSQNPLRDSNLGANRSTGTRQAAIAAGFSLVDAYSLFLNAGKPDNWWAYLTATSAYDTIHPGIIGDQKIFELARDLCTWPCSPSTPKDGLGNSNNLLSNSQFANMTSGVPENWTLSGCTLSQDTVNFETGTYGLKITPDGTGDAKITQALSPALIKQIRGRDVTLAVRVFLPSGVTQNANMGGCAFDGISNSRSYGLPSGGRDGFIWKCVRATVPTAATALGVQLIAGLSGITSATNVTFDRAILVVGDIPQDYFGV